MKILFISRFIPYTGGREVLLQRILHKISRTIDVVLATPDIGYNTPDFKVLNFKNKIDLEIIVKDLKPDIIHIHTFYFTKHILSVAKKNKIKIVLTLHGLFFNNYDLKYKKEILSIINKVNLVSVVCQKHREELINNGVKKEKIILIRNGIDAKNYNLNINKNRLRNMLNLPINDKIIVTPARLTPLKGLEYLVRSLKTINNKNTRILISTPTGRYSDEEIAYGRKLVELAKKINKNSNLIIQFHENNAMPLIYKACDIFVLPSISEGTPLSLLEAMSSGITCIATNVGGVSEIITKKTGYLIEAKKPEKIGEKVNKILRIGKINKKMSNLALKRIILYFNEKDMIRNYIKMYYNLIK